MSEDLLGTIPHDRPTIEDILAKEENYNFQGGEIMCVI